MAFTNKLNKNKNISFTVEPGAHHVSEDGEITEHQHTVRQINNQLKYTNKGRFNTVFGETQTVLALK